MAASLIAAGARPGTLAEARVVLLNTCTVTAEADAKSRKALRRSLLAALDATVIVCGCGAAVDAEQFEGIAGTHLVIADKELALQKALELLGLDSDSDSDSDSGSDSDSESDSHSNIGVSLRVGQGFNTRVQIKVQDGCDNRCSYCIVPLARGRARSMPLDKALAEIKAHTEAGAQEIVLTGIDLGNYQDGQNTLEVLLSKCLELPGSCRFRLSSIELLGITQELVQLIAASKGRICAHLHVPLQSGSDAILKAMNRPYDAAAFQSKITAAKKALPLLALTTDIIVGFPGETDDDFNKTLELCKELRFSRMHVFRYSKRPGTPAAALPGQVSATIKAQRSKELRQLAEELATADARGRINTTEQVLFETTRKARSESYYEVLVKENEQPGSLKALKIVGYEHGQLIAENG